MISLTVGPVTVALHPDLLWSDELTWHPVKQTAEHSLTGALVVDSVSMQGRPITLEPVDQSSAWTSRADFDQLAAWAAVPGQQMALSLRGVTHTVIWRHQDAPALTAEPIVHYSDVQSGDWYLARLKLTKVA